MSKLGIAAPFSKILFAILFATFAVTIAIHFSQLYYATAPFHYDSAFYLYRALQLYDVVLDNGRLQAALQILHLDKDFLDILLRVLIFPNSLQMTYGHLVVAFPFMVLFNFQLLQIVIKKTQSVWSGLLVVSFLFCFSFIYTPYQGIADYWKESVAMWILGSAFLSFILSDYLKNWQNSLLSGILFGLLIMERTGLSIYAALLLLPLVLKTFYTFYYQSSKTYFFSIMLFIIPAGLICLFVGLMEWNLLYQYYFVKGYDYVSTFHVTKHLIWLIIHFKWQLLPIITLAILTLVCLLSTPYIQFSSDILIASWLVIGFPLMISLTRGMYDGFYNTWCVLLAIFFATILPVHLNTSMNRLTLNFILSTIIVCSISIQFYLINQNRLDLMKNYAGWRVFYDALTDTIMKEKVPRNFSFIMDEDYAPFYDHIRLNRQIAFKQMNIVGFTSVHDSYYAAEFSDMTKNPQKLADDIIQSLEVYSSTSSPVLTVAYCDPKEVEKSQAFGMDSQKIAIPIITEQTQYLKTSSHWQSIKKLNSPYGCVFVYRYSNSPLTHTQKWQIVFNSH